MECFTFVAKQQWLPSVRFTFSRRKNFKQNFEQVFFSLRLLCAATTSLTLHYFIILLHGIPFFSYSLSNWNVLNDSYTPYIARVQTSCQTSDRTSSIEGNAMECENRMPTLIKKILCRAVNNNNKQPVALLRTSSVTLENFRMNVDGAVCCRSDYCCCCRSYPLHM